MKAINILFKLEIILYNKHSVVEFNQMRDVNITLYCSTGIKHLPINTRSMFVCNKKSKEWKEFYWEIHSVFKAYRCGSCRTLNTRPVETSIQCLNFGGVSEALSRLTSDHNRTIGQKNNRTEIKSKQAHCTFQYRDVKLD